MIVSKGELAPVIRPAEDLKSTSLLPREWRRVLDFRGVWDSLTRKAGLPGLLLHDFRRSAVRNMIRRGVPQKTAREICEISGHKTDTVFSRYNIVSDADIRDAARKIEEGAKAVMHSSFTVEQKSEPATE